MKGWRHRGLVVTALLFQSIGGVWAEGAIGDDTQRSSALAWVMLGASAVAVVLAKCVFDWNRAAREKRRQGEAIEALGRKIRTQLNGIVGNVELLLDSALDQEQREHVQTLHGCADELRRIVDEMLDAAEPGAGPAGSRLAPKSPVTPRLAGEQPEAAPQRPHYGRILVAEDNPVNQRVVVLLLKRLGYNCDAVANGAAAVAALRTTAYDLVLMDCQMPEMDGWTATRTIRDPNSAVLDPSIPIIALTANASAADRERALQAGMNDYLLKPIDFEQFQATLERWMADGVATSPASLAINAVTPHAGRNVAPPVFDRVAALRRLLDDEALLSIVVDALIEDLPRQTTALDTARQAGDAASLSRCAHSIKGAAANVGAEALRSVARELEHAAAVEDWPRIRSLRPALDLEIERFRREVRRDDA